MNKVCGYTLAKISKVQQRQDELIYLPRDQADQRFRAFKLTAKFQTVIAEWEEFIESVWSV